MGRASVPMGSRNIPAWNVVERAFVPMGSRNIPARIVAGEPIVSTTNGKSIARNVMVEGCARRHIAQPEKILSTKDIVFFALSIVSYRACG